MDREAHGTLGVVVEENIEISMRDGVVLRANVFRPDAPGRFPALLERTPYGKATGGMDRFVRSGYAVVVQDSRGRYASDGEFVPFTVTNTGDAEDGFDTVEWLAEQPYCNGRVGTMGASYNAWMQWELARVRPPHLRAMCAYTIPLELTEVDWTGAFKPGRRVKWWMTSIAPDLRRRNGLSPPHTPEEARRLWDQVERGRWLGFMPWFDLPHFLPEGLAKFVEDWLKNPSRQAWNFQEIHNQVDVPNLDFSGWYDHCGGTMRHLALMQRHGRSQVARQQTKLIIGPWNHPGLGQRRICGIDFGPQAEVDLTDLKIRWFDHWLKDTANAIDCEPACRFFVMGTGLWKSADTWPPSARETWGFFLQSGVSYLDTGKDGRLAKSSASGNDTSEFTYDARDPVPTLWSEELFSGPADRRLLQHREDILYFRSEVLHQEVEVVGYPQVILYVSSSAPDTDFFVRLVDESAEDGPALEVCYGMVRLRHRNGLESESFVSPGQVVELKICLGATACCFQSGHRIRLEVTSSDFPNHDRNHNTGGNDLAETKLAVARQRIFHSHQRQSRLLLPIA